MSRFSGRTPLEQWVAGDVFATFVQRLQDAGPHDGDPDWSQFRPDKWEHTRWLREDLLRNELQPALLDELQSRLPASPADEINETMLLRIIGREITLRCPCRWCRDVHPPLRPPSAVRDVSKADCPIAAYGRRVAPRRATQGAIFVTCVLAFRRGQAPPASLFYS